MANSDDLLGGSHLNFFQQLYAFDFLRVFHRGEPTSSVRPLAILAIFCTFIVPNWAAYADDWNDCKNWRDSPEESVRGCTAVINAGKMLSAELASAHQYRGIAYNKQGEHDRAMADFNRAIALDPNFAEAYQSRAARFEAQGLNDLAIKDFRKAVQLKPELTYAKESLKRLGASATPAPSATPTPPTATAKPVPKCPAGYVLSGNNCVKAATTAAPKPNCPSGFVFNGSQCMRAAAAPAPTAPSQPASLAYPLQSELKRIGCLSGRVDGIWGNGSRAALKRFAQRAGLRLGSEPSQNALDEARRRQGGFCQPVRVAPKRPKPKGCRSGTVFLEGQCIPRSQVQSFCGPGFERRGSKCVSLADQQQQSAPRPKNRCSAIKFAFTRGNTCACSGGRIFTGSHCELPNDLEIVPLNPQNQPMRPGECRRIGNEMVCS